MYLSSISVWIRTYVFCAVSCSLELKPMAWCLPCQGILLKANTPLIVYAWCDSDWGGCLTTRRSLTG
ncbi:unnamed protein product [Brassica oleracea var. botrytis]